jgi:hypothetical protein
MRVGSISGGASLQTVLTYERGVARDTVYPEFVRSRCLLVYAPRSCILGQLEAVGSSGEAGCSTRPTSYGKVSRLPW